MTSRHRWLAPTVMFALVAALYLPPGVWSGRFDLLGFDYLMLHQHRIHFAKQQLGRGDLPGWYPREFCGSPFWANVQNFPFIPTRLALLGLPTRAIYPAGVLLAAVISAGFTFLLARRWGMSPVASATAGWTFAASGFFASRVAAGHLPMLEVYPALPLLLWLTDRALADLPVRRFDAGLLALSCATAAIALGGHPQLWVYALLVAAAYAVVIARLRAIWALAAMGTGLGMACFALWPMMLLIARSARTLDLDRAANDIAMPYSRLLAAFLPWRDYHPAFDPAANFAEFTQGAVSSYFWDTVWYIGWLPWVMLLVLIFATVLFRGSIGRRGVFLSTTAVVALLLALPLTRELVANTGWTIFRSPARWMYVVVFALSLAAGAGVQVLVDAAGRLESHKQKLAFAAIAVLLLLHLVDLGLHSRHFVQADYPRRSLPPELEQQVRDRARGARVAIDLTTRLSINRSIDDVSAFDSILLARSYQSFLALKSAPPTYNNQWLPAYAFDAHILRAWGATVLITAGERKLPRLAQRDGLNIYAVENALPRAAWTATSSVDPLPQNLAGTAFTPLAIDRPSLDLLRIEIDAAQHGIVRIAEAIDPGWTATLNGAPADIHATEIMFMAVRVPPGRQVLELRYETPGWYVGAVLSFLGAAGAAAISLASARWPLKPARL